jgi:hypothetical protein
MDQQNVDPSPNFLLTMPRDRGQFPQISTQWGRGFCGFLLFTLRQIVEAAGAHANAVSNYGESLYQFA